MTMPGKCCLLLLLVGMPLQVPALRAAGYRVERMDQGPPAELADPIRNALQSTGLRVLQDAETVCEIWFRKSIPTGEPRGFSRSYPQLPDVSLLGAMRILGKMTDNRKNSFPQGLYTIRLGLQPQDGNHVGVSEYLDFAVLLNAAEDRSLEGDFETPRDMQVQSMLDGKAGHPIVFALLPPSGKEPPCIALNDNRHWVLEAKAGDMVLAMVIVGVYDH